MFKKTKIALSALMSVAFMGVAHADEWQPVKMSYSEKSQSYKVAQDFYKNLLISNPTIRIKTKTINLQTDNVPNPVGSVVVKFISPDTCSGLATENCMTTILKYDSEIEKWREVWEHHTKALYIGGPSPDAITAKQEGAFYHTLYTTDGLQWDWVNLSGIFYEPTPIGDKFVNFTNANKSVRANDSTVKYITQNYGWPTDVPYDSQQVDISSSGKPAYIVYPEYGPNCGQVGCTAALLVSDENNGGQYKPAINNDGTFTYNGQGWVVEDTGTKTGKKDIIIRNGTQLDGYVYSDSSDKYELELTSYPSDVVPTP